MARFLNEYTCPECDYEWQDEWDCGCDDDCPACGTRHISPTDSNELDGSDPSSGIHEAPAGVTAFAKADFGWFIYTGGGRDNPDMNAGDVPPDLAACIAKARGLGCDWLCIDCDGETVGDLPTYEW